MKSEEEERGREKRREKDLIDGFLSDGDDVADESTDAEASGGVVAVDRVVIAAGEEGGLLEGVGGDSFDRKCESIDGPERLKEETYL